MLELTRRVGDSIIIGDNITVTVRRVVGNCVEIGIDAPRDINIVREELLKNGRKTYQKRKSS